MRILCRLTIAAFILAAPSVWAADANPQVAQAGGASGGPAAAPESNPWIFGTTLYLWLPFATSTSTVGSLPPMDNHSLFNSETDIMNLFGGAGEFQLSKGDWGIFGNIAGATLGFKGTLLREDSRHPNREDRTGHFHDSVVSGQYGFTYRVLGRPLDLTTWARGTQPIALDLLAGAQTFYFRVECENGEGASLGQRDSNLPPRGGASQLGHGRPMESRPRRDRRGLWGQ